MFSDNQTFAQFAYPRTVISHIAQSHHSPSAMLRLVATLSVASVTTAFAPLAAPLLIHRHPHRHHRVLCQARASPPQPDATDTGASQLERSSLREADVALSKELLGGGAIAGPVVVAALLAFPELALASDAYPWAGPVRLVLDPALNLGQFWMLLRYEPTPDTCRRRAASTGIRPHLYRLLPLDPAFSGWSCHGTRKLTSTNFLITSSHGRA